MTVALQFRFEPAEQVLEVAFEPGAGAVASESDVAQFRAALEARCKPLSQRVHLLFDYTHLMVEAEQVPAFVEAKRRICEKLASSSWHYGGQLAERVMTRNDSTRRGEKPNLFKTREEALHALQRVRSKP